MVPGGKITLSNYACLPPAYKKKDESVGVGAWIYGWGRFGGGKTPPSNDLQETRGWIITQKACQRKYINA